jgi:CO/xanthine dehydrogenase Mo-binding subunit
MSPRQLPPVIGASVRRSDGEDKVRGAAVYGMDHVEPGMLHARLLRSPLPAGRIVRLDTTRAATMPGVRAVVTAADAPHLSGWVVKDQRLVAADEVRYVGEPVAAVAADTVEQAAAAVAAIDPLPAILTFDDALASDARRIHPARDTYMGAGPGGGNVAWESAWSAVRSRTPSPPRTSSSPTSSAHPASTSRPSSRTWPSDASSGVGTWCTLSLSTRSSCATG